MAAKDSFLFSPDSRKDGQPQELGLRGALRLAPTLREIRDPSPTVEFGLYRLFTCAVTRRRSASNSAPSQAGHGPGDFPERAPHA